MLLSIKLTTESASLILQYYQLATLRPDGRPANRTVVHRGFYGDNGITIVTDHRSLSNHPDARLVNAKADAILASCR